MEDNTTNDSSKVVEFTKRFIGDKSPTPPPTWNIMYTTNKEDIHYAMVTGYIFTLMPFVVITNKEAGAGPGDAVFVLPDHRLVTLERA